MKGKFDQNMSKKEKYENIIKKARAVLAPDDNILSKYANTCALIKEEFDWFWVGFYIVDDDKECLYLGPFQGPLACTNIPFTKGVCGKAYSEAMSQVIDDVDKFTGHIACSSESRSEIVIPVFNKDKILVSVLDIDSVEISSFDDEDRQYLESLVSLLFQ